MSSVEVLAPLRIETRFYPPDAQHPGWRLRLRVWPDEFSMLRRPAAPTPEELDLYDGILRQYPDGPAASAVRLRALAARLGMERALWLRNTVALIADPEGQHADRTAVQPRDGTGWPQVHQPYGLPPAIGIWFVPAVSAGGGPPVLAGTLHPDREQIAADLGLPAFAEPAAQGELPPTWWTDYNVAQAAGLAIELPFAPGAAPPALDAIVVAGLGDRSPEPLAAMHAATGRLSVLRPGTPTNTVDGEATAEMGANAAAWESVDTAPPSADSASAAVLRALGGPDTVPVKLQGGDIAAAGYDPLIVRALWPVLWGHVLQDGVGAGAAEARMAEWAADWLAPQGPFPAIRVGSQPYGLLPATLLAPWSGSDATAARIRDWVLPWRDAAAADAVNHPGTVVGASAQQAAELLGQHAPTRRWGLRLLSTLPVVNAIRATRGLPPLAPSGWDRDIAATLAGLASPLAPLAPFLPQSALPSSAPEADDPDTLRALLETDSEAFPLRWEHRLGLLGHLVFETLCLLRARVGLARETIDAGQAVDPTAPLPLHAGADRIVRLVRRGRAGTPAQPQLDDLLGAGGGAEQVAGRCIAGLEALAALVDAYGKDPAGVYDAMLASLDTASHRVDPWITGLACQRLRELAAARAPWRLGVYGWVDAPAPFGSPGSPQNLAPGPTAAGLLHAPSPTQAMTAALLRDAAVRDPADSRWQIQIDSAKVRAAIRLGERVRLGVHPYEALGLEVERIVGDWDTVRALRAAYPLRDTHDGRRCCDGARVLRLLFRPQPGDPPAPVLPAAVREALAVCDAALDTYADLLVADGVHALVSGQGGLGHAAMEAAAGMGPPPELRSIRTPRHSTSVRVSAWAVLPPGSPPTAGASPALWADPAFAALVDAQIGRPDSWTWQVGNTRLSLASVGLHGIDAMAMLPAELHARLRAGRDPALGVASVTGAAKLARAARLAELLGAGDRNPPVPAASDGRDDEGTAASPLRDAMMADLSARLLRLRERLQTLLSALEGVDPDDPDAVDTALEPCRAWRAVEPGDASPLPMARERLQARLATPTEAGVNGLRQAIRVLAGQPKLPVLPVVPAYAVGPLQAVAPDQDGRPVIGRDWLEIVAAVRPRLALLEAWQLDPSGTPWHAAVRTGDGTTDPWCPAGPVVVAYGPEAGPLAAGTASPDRLVAVTGLDAWQDAIPSREHTTSAAFGFNGPKSRAPQAVLLAVPPDASRRLSEEELAALVLETRQLARARACRPRPGSHVATPGALSSLPDMFWQRWS